MSNLALEGREKVTTGAGSNTPVGKILVVDDEPELKRVLVESLQRQGYEVTGCGSGLNALSELRARDFDLLVTDLMMPEMDGIALLKAALQIDPHLVGIIVTGQGTIQTAVDAMQMGAFDYVLKPFRMQTLMPVLTRAMNFRHLKLENVQLRETVAIHSLCQTIAFTLDPQTVLSKLADAALQQSDADEVSILLPTNDGTELYVAAVRGEKRERLLGERIPLQQSISSWVARERKPLILNGEVHDARFVALWPRPEIRSAVSVPMQVANKLVGVINLNVTNRLRPFTLGQMKALSILASTAAAALESASLYSQVQQAEKNYRSIFENAVEGIFQATPEGRFITVNPSMARILGYDSPEDLIETITDVSHQIYVDPERRLEAGRIQEKQGMVQGFEFEAYRKDGEKIWLSLNRRSIRNGSGTEIYREGSVEDITDRRRAEAERLVMSEIIQGVSSSADLDALLKLIHQTIQKVVYAENCFVALYDEHTDTLGMQFFVDKHDALPAPWKLGKSCTAHVFRTGKSSLINKKLFDQLVEAGEVELIGEPSPSWLGVPINTPAKTIGVLVVQHYEDDRAYSERDVEFLSSVGGQIGVAIERKRAEHHRAQLTAEIENQRQRLNNIVASVPGIVWEARGQPDAADQRIDFVSDYVELMLGYRVDECLAAPNFWLSIMHPHDKQRAARVTTETITSGKSGTLEFRLIAKDGREVWMESNFVGVIDKNGQPVGLRGVNTDITERKYAEESLKQSERKLAEAQRMAQIGSWNWDLRKNAMTWSDEHYRIFGVQRGEIDVNHDDTVFDFIHPEDRELVRSVVAKTTETREPFNFYYRIVRRDGEERILQSSGRVETDKRGKSVRMFGTAQDVTERRRIEQELRQSEERYRDLVENAHDLIYEHDLAGNYTSINKAGERITGYSLDEGLKLNLRQTVAPNYLEKAKQMLSQKLAGEKVTAYELEIVAKDGHRVAVEVNTRLVHKDGVPIGVQGIARDITERKRAEEALRESEARKRAILESSMDCIITMDREGLVVDWNPAAEKAFGYMQKEALGRRMADLIIPQRFREQHNQGLKRYIATGEGRVLGKRLELSAQRRDGTEFPIELTITRIDSKGESMFTGYLRDITERKKAENRLSAQYAVTRALAESNTISDGASKILQAVCESLGWEYGSLWTVDRGANVLRCSQTWQAEGAEAEEFEITSRQSVFPSGVGLPGRVWNDSKPLWIADVVAEPNFPRSSIAAKVGLHGGCAFPIQFRSEILGVVEFFSRSIRAPDPDLLAMMVTIGSQIGQFIARKRAEEALGESEEQLRQSQKLEAIGQLAGGVAHDFNNLLTAINGYSALALRRVGEDHPISPYLEEIKKAGDRAANLTRQLLAFGRKQMLQPLALNLNSVVSDMTKMLKRLIGEDIQLVTKLSPALHRVKADPGQIEQVLMNLIVNGRDAMPTGGRLIIETSNANLDAQYARQHIDVAPGAYVMLAVSDTGSGMDHGTQAHIFEPFFTTKEKGKGTGLGLSTVYGIVKQSGGNIWVYSERGRGTTFKIYLPQIEKTDKRETVVAGESVLQRGSELVVLVEDEEMVRNLASELLTESGYRVLTANGGEEAVELFKQHKQIDLLITDVVMPTMSGKKVAELLRKTHPKTKVLFMSGYTDDAIVHHGIVDSGIAFIQKPFSESGLTQKVREVLDGGNGRK